MIDLSEVKYDIGNAAYWLPKAIEEIKELRLEVQSLKQQLEEANYEI
jgi:regulator of replication initiation timing